MSEGYFRTQCRGCDLLVYEGPWIPPRHARQSTTGGEFVADAVARGATAPVGDRPTEIGCWSLTALEKR